MMVVARGVAGFGAGGEYPVCATNATEAADETASLRKKRGFLVAVTTDFAVDLVSSIINSGKHLDTLPNCFLGICRCGYSSSHCHGLLPPGSERWCMACVLYLGYRGKWHLHGSSWNVSSADVGIFQLPVTIFFFRIRMANSTQYRKHAIRSQYPYWLTLKRYWKPMLGTCKIVIVIPLLYCCD